MSEQGTKGEHGGDEDGGSEQDRHEPRPAAIKELMSRVEDREFQVGVIGLGYVGLPLGLVFAEAGFSVLGFDIDDRKVDALTAGRSYIDHLGADRIQASVTAGRLAATSNFERLAEPDALLICVPTPLDRYREPDLSYVETTVRQASTSLRRGQLVILESTTYPGTTDELVRPLLEASGLQHGKDFYLAFSPEREDPGNQQHTTTQIPKVVGGVDGAAKELAVCLYSQVFERVVPVSSTRVAEATKLTENIYRAVNIALVNELKTVYDAMGIDIWEVLDAAQTKPFGFTRFNPGPGWGGHCIPVDPFYLSWKAREYGLRARFIELSGEVNIEMPRYVISKLQDALNTAGKPVKGSGVMVIGLAYKPNVADPRESPSFEIIARLVELGAEVCYHDPLIPEAPTMRTWPDLPAMASVDIDPETVSRQDAVLIITDHSGINYDQLTSDAQLIVDTRGVCQPGPKVVRA